MRGDSKEERLFCISDKVQCNRHRKEGERERRVELLEWELQTWYNMSNKEGRKRDRQRAKKRKKEHKK